MATKKENIRFLKQGIFIRVNSNSLHEEVLEELLNCWADYTPSDPSEGGLIFNLSTLKKIIRDERDELLAEITINGIQSIINEMEDCGSDVMILIQVEAYNERES